jgi:hypothetical protein
MDEVLRAPLEALADEVRAAAIPDGGKHTALWCVGQLAALYAKFRQTGESRYGDEITRLVQGVLKELSKGGKGFPGAPQLAASITERLRLLHERLGLPGLGLKPPAAPKPRTRKVG